LVSNRTVVFLDILGFKNKIQNESLVELSEEYERLIDTTEAMNRPFNNYKNEPPPTLFPGHHETEPWCIKHIFSDSIFLVSNGPDELSALKTLVYAWRLSQTLLAMKMPARGGISYGEIAMNLNKNIMLGKGLTEAYLLESKQQWIGVSIDSNLEEQFPSLFQNFSDESNPLSLVFQKYPVPFKDGSFKELYTLNWRLNFVVKDGTKSILTKETSGDIGAKITNTLNYAKSFVSQGKVYLKGEGVPGELRTFWVGDTQPPFKHGDEY